MPRQARLAVISAGAIAICGTTTAQAQIFEITVDRTIIDTQSDADGIVKFSLWMDTQGSTAGFLSSFTGWAGFSGTFSTDGGVQFAAPGAELGFAGDTTNGGDLANWAAGRRPPEFFGVPGGAAGGFRFQPQSYEAGQGYLRGAGDTPIEGIAASSALGGFSHNTSSRVEVFRGSIDLFAAAPFIYTLQFNLASADIFIDDAFNISRSVFGEMTGVSVQIGCLDCPIYPTPGTLSTLIFAGLGISRRRR